MTFRAPSCPVCAPSVPGGCNPPCTVVHRLRAPGHLTTRASLAPAPAPSPSRERGIRRGMHRHMHRLARPMPRLRFALRAAQRCTGRGYGEVNS